MGSRDTLSRDVALVQLLLDGREGTGRAGEFAASIAALGLRTRLQRTGRSDEIEELDKMIAALLECSVRSRCESLANGPTHPGRSTCRQCTLARASSSMS